MTAHALARHLLSVSWLVLVLLQAGCGSSPGRTPPAGDPARPAGPDREEPFVVREFRPYSGDRWIGDAVCYGPHRDGQYPGGPGPSRAELREDLRIMARRWNLLRIYGSVGPAETILEIIREDQLDVKLLLGIWIDVEQRVDSAGTVTEDRPDARAANRREIDTGIRLANAFPEIVLGVSVGNETQVDWSAHRSSPERLVAAIREVRSRVRQPVTTVDDRNYWNKPASRAMAREVDFIVAHVHPLWGGQQLETALDWTKEKFAEVQRVHPDHLVVLGETGWATRKHVEGEQATLIKGRPGEAEQARFFSEVTAWINAERIPMFFFEAFDENWKGGPHPDEVEKHWGLHDADRRPKLALADGR